MTSRRDFLSLAAGAGLALTSLSTSSRALARLTPTPPSKKKILFLGGTGFLGPVTVEAALARGHEVTLFNRGKTNPHLFPDLEKLVGDRKTSDLAALKDRKWDAVIDTSAYYPRVVTEALAALHNNINHYVLITTVSVYAGYSKINMNEDDPLATLPEGTDPATEKVGGETYGPLKALCEHAANAALPNRVANIRPGLIVGRGDPTDRYTYWPVRVARAGEVLAPGAPSDPVQIIDVRDLADFIVRAVEQSDTGAFNATGPVGGLPISKLLDACRAASSSSATFTWADADFLEANEVRPWADMPVWLPPKGDYAGFGQIDVSRAVARGLSFRSPEDTARDTLAWFATLPEERRNKLKAGLTPEREAELLKLLHARNG